jgi:hypothetical protein
VRHIQLWFRSYSLARREMAVFNKKRLAITRIASVYRGVLVRRWYVQQLKSIVLIQAQIRGLLARKRTAQFWKSRTRKVSNFARQALLHLKAICIQKWYRRHAKIRWHSRMERAATTIQAHWRTHCERQKYVKLRQVTLWSQKRFRHQYQGRLHAATRIQRWFRTSGERRQYLQNRSKIVRIQSLWRGYRVRKMRAPKLQKLCHRIAVVNSQAEEHMKLGNRTASALDTLVKSSQLSSIIRACHHLGNCIHFCLIIIKFLSISI